MNRKELLQKAEEIINGARQESYGTPEKNFSRIGVLWGVQLERYVRSAKPGDPVPPELVAALMVQVKMARLIETPDHIDSWLDTAGYAACGGEIVTE